MTNPSPSSVATRHLQATAMSPMAQALLGYLKTTPGFKTNILEAIASSGESLGEPPRKPPPSWSLPKTKGRGRAKSPIVAPVVETPVQEVKPWVPPTPVEVVETYLSGVQSYGLEGLVEDYAFKKWFEKTVDDFLMPAGVHGGAPWLKSGYWLNHKAGVLELDGTLVGDSIDNDVEDIGPGQDDGHFISKYLKATGADGASWIFYHLQWVRDLDSAAITYPIKVTWELPVADLIRGVIPRTEMLRAAEKGLKKARENAE